MAQHLGFRAVLLDALLCAIIISQYFLSPDATKIENSNDYSAEANNNIEWDYEPRVWSPDDDESDLGLQEEFYSDAASDDGGTPTRKLMADGGPNIKIRERSYFFNENHRKLTKVRHTTTTRQEQHEEKCDQFRVDVKETVICDNNRCDKLDFEWPQHDNQLVLIQTTKFGMRFHRAEFAFENSSPPVVGLKQQQQQQEKTKMKRKNHEQKIVQVKFHHNNDNSRVKFDLFDFLKPKPTSTTTTTTTTTTVSPTTVEPPATTSKPRQSNSTEPQSSTTAKPTAEVDDNIESQDKNSTRLVTTFRLDTRRRVQTMIGFGGALSDSTCRNIKSLSSTMSKHLMEDYFGPKGLRYNLARMSIGSSDFSVTPYTNNDGEKTAPSAAEMAPPPPNGFNREKIGSFQKRSLDETDDLEMKRFRLTDEDYEYKLPVARQAIALSRQELKFFSSLWSPPVWMKNNSHIVHGYLKGDIYGPYYKALADYIIRWHEAYKKNGLEFWATTGLNEPVTGIKPFIYHNSLGITRDDYVTFIKLHLGPMLRQRGLGQLKLIAMDDNKGYAPQLVKALLDDPEAAKYVSGIGVHWYMNDEYENLNFLTESNYSSKGYFLLSTEACNGYLPFQVHTLPGNWDRGVAYMLDMIKLIQKNAAGWVDWNMALNLYGGPSWANNFLDSPVIVNPERDEYYKSPAFYAIGHFSRFVEPNSTRLDHRLANAKYDQPLEAVAFLTPREYIVIVVLNANRYEVPFKLIVNRRLIKLVTLREESFTTMVFKSPSLGARG